MNVKYFFLICVLCWLPNMGAKAQERFTQKVIKLEEIADGVWWAKRDAGLFIHVRSQKTMAIPGAQVVVVSGKDTIKITVNEDGKAQYSDSPLAESVKITVTHPDYETREGVVKTPATVQMVLEPKNQEQAAPRRRPRS